MRTFTTGSLSVALRKAIKRAQGSIKLNATIRNELKCGIYQAVQKVLKDEFNIGPKDPRYRRLVLLLTGAIKTEVVVDTTWVKPV